MVKYITQEVIDESQRMYEFAEKHKAELSYAKSMHHAEQKEKTKRVVTEAYNTVKRNLTKIPAKFHKKEDQDGQKQKARIWWLTVGFYFGALHWRLMADLDSDTLSKKQQLIE